MKISIIIPVHNSQDSIQKCVSSIIGQDINELEVILIENNSSDHSLEICKEIAQKNQNICIDICTDIGVSAARNKGLGIATGDIIGFCDSDDYLDADCLKKILLLFESNIDILISGFSRVLQNGEKKTIELLPEGEISSTQLMEKILNDNRVMGSVWNKFYKAEFIKNHRFNQKLSYCEDTHFNITLLSSNRHCKCWIANVRTYNYVENPTSATANFEGLFDNDGRLKYINSMYQILKDCQIERYIRHEVGYAIVGLAIGALHDLSADKLRGRKEDFLIWEIRLHIIDYFLKMWKYSPKYNIKRLIWIFDICYLKRIKNSIKVKI